MKGEPLDEQVSNLLGEFSEDFDIPGIIRELQEKVLGCQAAYDLSEVPLDEFHEIVRRHPKEKEDD